LLRHSVSWDCGLQRAIAPNTPVTRGVSWNCSNRSSEQSVVFLMGFQKPNAWFAGRTRFAALRFKDVKIWSTWTSRWRADARLSCLQASFHQKDDVFFFMFCRSPAEKAWRKKVDDHRLVTWPRAAEFSSCAAWLGGSINSSVSRGGRGTFARRAQIVLVRPIGWILRSPAGVCDSRWSMPRDFGLSAR